MLGMALHTDEETLLTRDEDQWFDRKSFRIKPKDLAKTIVAFANAEGGTIAVGITDRKFDGMPSTKQDNELRQATFDHTDPTVRVKIETVNPEENVSVYLFHVLPSDRVHYLKSGECFLRVGDETRSLGPDDILELRYSKGEQQFDASVPAHTSLEDLDMQLVEQYAEAIGSSSAMDALKARNLINRNEQPRTAAILLFGNSPQHLFPNAHVRVVRFNEPARLPGQEQQIVGDERFEGTLPQQIHHARNYISSILPKVRRLSRDGLFEEENLIPQDVWLEGLVNAVIHRSYSMSGDHIRFEVYPDRIEISSPGRFPGLADPTKPEQISRFARNPLIARVTAELRIGQELGEGIRRMFAGMRKVGFADPIYAQTSGSVVLTLNAVQRLGQGLKEKLPRYSEEALLALQNSPLPLSTGQVADTLGVSNPPVRRALQALRNAGLITWSGNGPRDPRATWNVVAPLNSHQY